MPEHRWLPSRRKVPVSFQLDAMDCGPACLDMVAQYHGRQYARSYLRELCRQDRLGSSMAGIAAAAERVGFRTLAIKVSYDSLRRYVELPCIAYWPQGHYVVIEQVRQRWVRLVDPAIGSCRFSRAEFENCWLSEDGNENSGILLLLEPARDLSTEGLGSASASLASIWRTAWPRVKSSLFPFALAGSVSLVAQLILPFLSALLVNLAISTHAVPLIRLLLAAEIAFALSQVSVEFAQQWTLAHLAARLDLTLIAAYLAKLTALPARVFEGKLLSELLERVNDQKKLQQFLSDSIGQVLFSGLSILVFGMVLAILKPELFAGFLLGAGVYVVYSSFFFRYQRILNYKSFRLAARRQGVILDLLTGMQEIKLNNAERERRWEWERAQHALARVQIKNQRMAALQRSGGNIIIQVTSLSLAYLSALQVMSHQMSFGMLIAVQYVVGQVSGPLQQLAGLILQSYDARLCYARTLDVQSMPDETPAGSLPEEAPRGDILLRNVSFSYGGPAGRKVLKNIHFDIPFGRVTAIVGTSGSGKSTMLKLLLKIWDADAGAILVGGVNLIDVEPKAWRSQLGVVMQDGYLLSDTILKNITLGHDEINLSRVQEVARVAHIHEFVESLPRSYRTKVGREGMGISRGQAQRLLIARALYKAPAYIFMDEATSALDAETESVIVKNLQQYLQRTTSVIIAHRMSTVKFAHQIIVLEDGEVVEVGRHDDLVAARSRYFSLVKEQLSLGA